MYHINKILAVAFILLLTGCSIGGEKKIKITREREIANALELIGGVKKQQVKISNVANRATVWILRNHEKYQNMKLGEISRAYVPFYSDARGNKKGGQ